MYKVIRFNAVLATKWHFFFFVQTDDWLDQCCGQFWGLWLWFHLWLGIIYGKVRLSLAKKVNLWTKLWMPIVRSWFRIRISSKVIYLPWKGGVITNSSEFCVNELFLSIYRTKNLLVFPAPQTRLQNTI